MIHASAARRVPDKDAARSELTDRAVSLVLESGFGDGSLRSMAARLDTSHRMLIYHFGSAQAFWDAVLRELQRRDLEAMAVTSSMESLEKTWERLTRAPSVSIFRVLFQLHGEALADPEGYADFLEQFVGGWLEAIERGLRKHAGLKPAEARLHARLNLAVIRGLMLDLITTGDLEATTAALHAFARQARAARRRRP
jgi:AcrR family transcriptional regulator